MKIAIVINNDRYQDDLKQKLGDASFSATLDLTYDVFAIKPDEFDVELPKINFKTYNCILIGGGDGTVRTVIQHVIDDEVPIAILPLGTFNVLAKDLEYPDNIEE